MQTLKHDGAKSISIQAHVANYRNQHLALPKWQRNGQKVWEGEYRSDLIESIMLGIDIPKLYLGILREHPGKTMIIDGGHRTRCLDAYVNNEFAWEITEYVETPEGGTTRSIIRVYYSDSPKDLRNNRVMTPQERNHFDNYKLTIVCYRGIAEKQARQIFNRLQNAAPMAMADVVNSYESDLVEFFREEVRPKLLKGNEDYKHLKGVPLKHPDTNEDIYQFLSWYTIINPSGLKEDALKNIEMGKGREENRCFGFLREFDESTLTHSQKTRFKDAIDTLIGYIMDIPKLNNGEISSLLYASLYIPNFSLEKFKEFIDDIKKYKGLDSESSKYFKIGRETLAHARKNERDALDATYDGFLAKWQKSKQQNGMGETNMVTRNGIIQVYCVGENVVDAPYVEGDALEPFVMSA